MKPFLIKTSFCVIISMFGSIAASAEPDFTEYQRPMVPPKALLIHRDCIHAELSLEPAQQELVTVLCQSQEPILFALRDIGVQTNAPSALKNVRIVEKNMLELDRILKPNQRKRLNQLELQFAGFGSLLWKDISEKLQLNDFQRDQIRNVLQECQKKFQDLEQKARTQQVDQSEYDAVYQYQYKEILKRMNKTQQNKWRLLIGSLYNFDQCRPVFFSAPEFRQETEWINSDPLRLANLGNRVIVVHFWANSCQNCINNYPSYQQWQGQYDPKNVLMIGIHTPETESDKKVDRIREQMQKNNLNFPVLVDNEKANWDAWGNNIWPAVYVIDKQGQVRYWWYGELNYEGAKGRQWIEDRIAELQRESGEIIGQ